MAKPEVVFQSMNRPLISVVIPTYNCESYIAEAIESVLRQNYVELELIIVNDGSTDGTLAVCERFGSCVYVISQHNQGVASARNTGIRAANGSVIGFLDADDLWTDNHVHAMLPMMASLPHN
jgi:glycosyltransferase involved in cell wall biosynthesis